MIQPTFRQFRVLAKKGKRIPVFTEFLADLETPVTLFSKVGATAKHAFLFESAEVSEKVGRYSFIGVDPEGVLELTNGVMRLRGFGSDRKQTIKNGNEIFDILRKLIHDSSYVQDVRLPNFLGGLVGFIGYEFVRYCEDIELSPKKGLSVPDAVLFSTQTVIIYDHFSRKIQIVHLANPSKKNLKTGYREACALISGLEKKIRSSRSKLSPISMSGLLSAHASKIASNTSKSKFESNVSKAKAYIKAGDCIQAVLSQRFSLGKVSDDFLIYRVLRVLNPSPYMFYFKYGGLRLVGSSPETFVKKRGAFAETRPIAGTRPRGASESIDRQMETNLKNSVKEMAEHLMLVDLGRNDLGRVCDPKTVKVSEFAKVERYSHVMHLVSNVEGKLKRGMDALELFKACFPAGTVSGAPKIRAMEIIDEFETEKRGAYAGAVGYFDFNGDMDFCITIRTIVIQDGKAYVQAGAGIVSDSKPSNEYQETINKAKALLRAKEIAELSFS